MKDMVPLVWGRFKGSWKPFLFDVRRVRDEDWSKELLTRDRDEIRPVIPVSGRMYMERKELNNLMNHYGIAEIYEIIGRRECLEVYYDAEV